MLISEVNLLRFVYDEQADALAIWFSDTKPERTIDLTEDIFMDVDDNNRLIGIEVLRAKEKSDFLNISKISIQLQEDKIVEVDIPELLKKQVG